MRTMPRKFPAINSTAAIILKKGLHFGDGRIAHNPPRISGGDHDNLSRSGETPIVNPNRGLGFPIFGIV